MREFEMKNNSKIKSILSVIFIFSSIEKDK